MAYCKQCGKLLKSDEAAIYRRLIYRDAEEYLCILCLAKELGVEPRVIEDKNPIFQGNRMYSFLTGKPPVPIPKAG